MKHRSRAILSRTTYALIASASLLLSAAIWAVAEVNAIYAAERLARQTGLGESTVKNWIRACAMTATLISLGLGGALIFMLRRRLSDARAARRRLRSALRQNRLMLQSVTATNHEVRAPIEAIAGFARLLAATTLDARQARLVDTLSRSSEHVLRISGDLVDLSANDDVAPSIMACELRIDDMLSLVADLTRVLVGDKPVAVVTARAAGVPPVAIGDPVRIQQVLINLTSNAARHAQGGTIAIHCSRIDAEPPRIRFDVSDEGPGIPLDEQEHLFRSRRHPSGALFARRGWGLGLVISSRLVQRMGGRIGLMSSSPQGSRFWVELPLVEPMPAAEDGMAAPPAPAPVRPTISILIADDSEASLSLVTLLLCKWADCVTAVRDGRHAVVAARTLAFDLILLDLQMTGMGGLEAAAAIRALPQPFSSAAIYAFSNGLDADVRDACRDAGLDGCLLKPLRSGDIEALLRRVADRRVQAAKAWMKG